MLLTRRLRRTVGAPAFRPFNYPQFCLLFQTFTKMPLKRLSSRPARSKLCPLFGSESSPNSSPKPLNSYLWVIERLESRGSHPLRIDYSRGDSRRHDKAGAAPAKGGVPVL